MEATRPAALEDTLEVVAEEGASALLWLLDAHPDHQDLLVNRVILERTVWLVHQVRAELEDQASQRVCQAAVLYAQQDHLAHLDLTEDLEQQDLLETLDRTGRASVEANPAHLDPLELPDPMETLVHVDRTVNPEHQAPDHSVNLVHQEHQDQLGLLDQTDRTVAVTDPERLEHLDQRDLAVMTELQEHLEELDSREEMDLREVMAHTVHAHLVSQA